MFCVFPESYGNTSGDLGKRKVAVLKHELTSANSGYLF